MFILARVAAWILHRGSDDERLVAETRALATGLLSRKSAKASLNKAKRLRKNFGGRSRWKTWRWLIRTHRRAREQRARLQGCHRNVEEAIKRNLDNKQFNAFIKSFRNYDAKLDDLADLKTAIEKSLNRWSEVQTTIRKVQPPIFFTRAFLKISNRSGIETASLLVGGLIALGAVYMAFFYQAAVGLSASAYWTLDDLIIQGMLVIPYVLVVVIVIETINFFVGRFLHRRARYLLHGWILKRPAILVIPVFLLMALVVSSVGYWRGITTFSGFAKMTHEDAQMATVLDRSALHNVYLVGTSDRTAIFLRAEVPIGADANTYAKWQDRALSEPVNSYYEALVCVARDFWPDNDNPHSCQAFDENFKVLVMDRALIVCHAKEGDCKPMLEDGNGEQA